MFSGTLVTRYKLSQTKVWMFVHKLTSGGDNVFERLFRKAVKVNFLKYQCQNWRSLSARHTQGTTLPALYQQFKPKLVSTTVSPPRVIKLLDIHNPFTCTPLRIHFGDFLYFLYLHILCYFKSQFVLDICKSTVRESGKKYPSTFSSFTQRQVERLRKDNSDAMN